MRSRVAGEILALTANHQDPEEEPPFSAGELVIMACMTGEHGCLDPSDIARQIIRLFPYYQSKAIITTPTCRSRRLRQKI